MKTHTHTHIELFCDWIKFIHYSRNNCCEYLTVRPKSGIDCSRSLCWLHAQNSSKIGTQMTNFQCALIMWLTHICLALLPSSFSHIEHKCMTNSPSLTTLNWTKRIIFDWIYSVQTSDRRRLITRPVIYVPQTPETFYDNDTENSWTSSTGRRVRSSADYGVYIKM